MTQPTENNPYQGGRPQYAPQQPAPKKPWYKKKRIIIPITAVVVIGLGIAISGGDDEPTTTKNEANADTKKDTPAIVGDIIHTKKADITTTNFRDAGPDVFEKNNLCVDYTIKNTSEKDTIDLTESIDWKLTDPGNVTIDATYGSESTGHSVKIGPGGEKSGTACFEAEAQPGEYKVKYEESFSFSSQEAVWTAKLD